MFFFIALERRYVGVARIGAGARELFLQLFQSSSVLTTRFGILITRFWFMEALAYMRNANF